MLPLRVVTIICSIQYIVSANEILRSSGQDDDLEFIGEKTGVPHQRASINEKIVPVERQWGVPDARAVVGRLFHSKIPADAFSGHVDHFEVVNQKGKIWPKWLNLSRDGVLKGVPELKDFGETYLVVKAVGPYGLHSSKDIFAIEVLKPAMDSNIPAKYKQDECSPGIDSIMLSIILDVAPGKIEPLTRVSILENLAGYFGIPVESIYLHEQTTSVELLSLAHPAFFMAGSGNVKMQSDREYAGVSFQIGCGQVVKDKLRPLLVRVREEAKDGTLAEVLLFSVVGWHARSELPSFFRDRREAGSGDLYALEEDDEEDYNEGVTTMSSVTHPHRHHHGEEENDLNVDLQPSEVHYQRPSTSLLMNYDNILSTPVFIPERPTVLPDSITPSITILPTKVVDIEAASSVTDQHLISSEIANETVDHSVTVPIALTTNELINATELLSETTFDGATPSLPRSTFTRTSAFDTTLDHVTSNTFPQTNYINGSLFTVTSTSTTEDELESGSKNFPPRIGSRLQKVAVVAGKVLRFKIRENTFVDVEDGSTSQLSVSFKTIDEKSLPLNSWITFNSTTKEIIALPLEEHVSKWEFIIEARDKDGDKISDTFELQVQQYKSTRAVNHELTLSLNVNQGQDGFTRALDWQLAVLDALVRVYGDPDASKITVRNVLTATDHVSFTWTNDTLPRGYCPRDEINRLLKVLSPNEDGYPAVALQEALGKGITALRVSYRGLENCEVRPVVTMPPPKAPIENFAPVPRNQIDQINATVGQLLIFKVPEDTFYDPEEGGTRGLKMSLLNMDLTEISADHWLQFDAKNQEFYGLPMEGDASHSREYQLVCEDRGGLTANDGLVVVVRPRQSDPNTWTVLFTIALDMQYKLFVRNAATKRRFLEKLAEVFGDPTTDAIEIGSITDGSTIISWYNRSLPTDHCPDEQIQTLKRKLIDENEVMTQRLVNIMAAAEFKLISVGLEAAGLCLSEMTVHHKPDIPFISGGGDESEIIVDSERENYLITFVIPAAIITFMLIVAGLVACFLYRRRRVSKMGVGDEDERQSFRSKGIPVIFQDEFEEKPLSDNKPPVIMKEEKPPLPPPDYQRGNSLPRTVTPKPATAALTSTPAPEDTPYHPPPPPFPASSGGSRGSRSKGAAAGLGASGTANPTYRMPPPYVPP